MFHDVKWWKIARQNWAHREFVSGKSTASADTKLESRGSLCGTILMNHLSSGQS